MNKFIFNQLLKLIAFIGAAFAAVNKNFENFCTTFHGLLIANGALESKISEPCRAKLATAETKGQVLLYIAQDYVNGVITFVSTHKLETIGIALTLTLLVKMIREHFGKKSDKD